MVNPGGRWKLFISCSGVSALVGRMFSANGSGAAVLSGEENADQMRIEDGKLKFLSNMAGGILGGISTGQDITVSLAIKPTSSIRSPRRSIDLQGKATVVETLGRHDPCVGIRAVPIAEAMLALVLMDHVLRHRAQCGDVRVAVERHPQRHAHRAEEERREEREPDGGYTASSAPSGVGLPRENSGMNTCASGPIDSA